MYHLFPWCLSADNAQLILTFAFQNHHMAIAKYFSLNENEKASMNPMN